MVAQWEIVPGWLRHGVREETRAVGGLGCTEVVSRRRSEAPGKWGKAESATAVEKEVGCCGEDGAGGGCEQGGRAVEAWALGCMGSWGSARGGCVG